MSTFVQSLVLASISFLICRPHMSSHDVLCINTFFYLHVDRLLMLYDIKLPRRSMQMTIPIQ